ncbi:MAG: T9SS type A sorting domain-containing protein [Psychroserpens sp.]|uniref:T9SS type A sorting domain-containing protein n=1 Tax=Psychroserpens sp. TaxID=2020870 RepID=UPI003CB4EE29
MKKIYFLCLAVLVTTLSFGQDLILTGAYDGPVTGGTPKGIELYVVNNIADLSIYAVGSANNGGGTDGEEFTFPAVSADAGDYIYVATETPNFNAFFGFDPDYTDGSMGINGDDAIELFQNGTVVDVFGDIDVDGNGEPWEYLDGWAYRVDGSGPDGNSFVVTNWTYSGVDQLEGGTTNAACNVPFPIGTYTATANTNPTISISSPFDNQALDAGTTTVDVVFTTANAPGATVTMTVIKNGGTPEVVNNATSPFQVGPAVDGDTFSVTADLVDGGVLDSDMVNFSIAFPCDIFVGTIVTTCDAVTSGTTDTYNVTIDYAGGATTAYTVDTGGVGVIGGDNPSSVADGTILITGVTEGTDFVVTFTGDPLESSCDFTRNINSPDCDPQLPLPLYEGFDYTVGSNLIDTADWSNISDSTDEILIGGPGGLTYTGFAAGNQTGNHITFDGGGSDTAIEFTPIVGGTLYASFLMNVSDNMAITSAGYFAILGDFDARLWTVPGVNAGEYQIGISNVNAAPTAGALDSTILLEGDTVLVVMSYDTVTGVINTWVNPDAASFGSTAPAASATDTDATPQTSLNQFVIRQDSSTETPFILFDELRLGATWADVTPTTLSTNGFTANTFKIFPNPTSTGFVNITSVSDSSTNVAVYDILGKQVINETLVNDRVNVSALNTGLYIVKISQNGTSVTKKLVIE